MATTVQIELQVDSNGAVQGVRTFDASVKGAAGSTALLNKELGGVAQRTTATADAFSSRLNAAIAAYNVQCARGIEVQKVLGAEFDKFALNNSAVVAYEKAAAAAAAYVPVANSAAAAAKNLKNQMSGGYGEARIAASAMMGSTRGMAMGLANVLGRSKALAGAWQTMMPAMLWGAGIVMIVQAGTEVYNLYEKYLSLTAAAEAYRKEVEKAADQQFGDSHSIETTTARIDEATDAIRRFQQEAEKSQKATFGARSFADILMPGAGSAWQLLHARSSAHDQLEQSYELQHQVDKLQDQAEGDQYHQQRVRDIEEAHAADAELRGLQKINAEKQKSIDLNFEERRYGNERDRIRGVPVAPDATPAQIERAKVLGLPNPMNAGQSEEAAKDRIAQQTAEAEAYNLQREQGHELAQLRAQAVEAGLRGSALYHAQEAAAIEDLKFKDMDSAAARNATHLKFHNEEMARLRDEATEVAKAREEATGAGLTGVAKIQVEGQERLTDIYSTADKRSPGATLALVYAANQRTHGEMIEADREFTQHVDELADESATHQISGFARIRADAQKQIDSLTKEYQGFYGEDTASPDYRAHVGELNRGTSAINAGAGEQTSELAHRNAEETAQIELEARAKSMSAEKQKTLAIQAELQQRLEKYQDELRQQEISQDDYNRRVLAAQQEADAEMIGAARAAREKMAGEFTSMFRGLDHPLRELQTLGDKVAGQAAAALVQRAQNRFGKGQGEAPGGMFGGIFDKIAGVPSGATDRHAETAGRGSAPGSMTVGMAQIHVNSGTIVFGGGGGFGGGSGTGAGLRSPAYSAGAGGSTYETGTGSMGGWSGAGGGTNSGGYSGVGTGAGATYSGASAVGGAGDAGYSGTAPGSSLTGGPGVAPPKSNMLASAVNDVGSGISLGKQAMSMFGGGAGGSGGGGGAAALGPDTQSLNLDLNGNPTPGSPTGALAKAPGNGSMLSSGIGMGNAMGAAGGALGLYSAAEGNGGVGGALSGAMSGMQLGMAVGGPIGAAIGAAGGAILGALGLGGREKAKVYDERTVRPHIAEDQQQYETGSLDYLNAYSDMQTLDTTAERTTKQWGPAAHDYYNDTIQKEIKEAEGKFTAMERGGRSQFSASTAQYASGTDSVPAMLSPGERIIPSDQNERITRALEHGTDMKSVAQNYRTAMQAPAAQRSGNVGWTGDMHVHAIDAKGVKQFLDDNKHGIRAAVNSSYAENSGGADAGY